MADRGIRRGYARRGNEFGDESGLDADLLDGQHGSYYQSRANHTGTQDHNSTLSGLQGGSTSERYHLTSAQHTNLTEGFKRGEMYNFNVPTTITISTANTWTPISTGFSEGSNNGVTFQNASELKIVTAGTYKSEWVLSLDTAAAGVEIEAGLMINGTIQEKTATHHYFGTANDTATLVGQGWLSVIADDVITMAVNNNTSATDVIMEHASVLLSRWPQ